ncbi:MAG TPA: M15 family metallopeptidase [Bacillota bacterium]|nr:M15 family metallopeptidase [Bacillota bacterium]
MQNEKKIKTIIVIALFLIEIFVWTTSSSGNFQSFDGNAKPPAVIGSNDLPGGGRPDQSGGQQPGQGNEGPEEPKGQDGGNGYPTPDDPNREKALEEAKAKGLLILVNKEHPVDQNYKPDDLSEVKYYAPDRDKAARYMRAEAAEAFDMLVEKAAEEGVVIKMTTAYRSYNFQKILFDSYVKKEGEEKANTYSAKPGQSEHQTGLSVDVSSPSVDYQLSNDYGKTAEGKWLANNAYRFGFILRFLQGKENITGYQYEPWHIRYVGLTAAKEIYEQGLTLEEYLLKNEIE